jgi:hypothetical protein
MGSMPPLFNMHILCVGKLAYCQAMEKRYVRWFAKRFPRHLLNKVRYTPKPKVARTPRAQSKLWRWRAAKNDNLRINSPVRIPTYGTVCLRMQCGETFEEALLPRPRKGTGPMIEYKGRMYTKYALAKVLGVSYQAIEYRRRRGMPLEFGDDRPRGRSQK